MKDNYTLTGNIRYTQKKRLLRSDRVVVEVEVSWPDGPDDFNGMPTYLGGKGWKEATMEDLFNLTMMAGAALHGDGSGEALPGFLQEARIGSGVAVGEDDG